MKYIILSVLTAFCSVALGQTSAKLGPTEQKMNDFLCDCITKQDLSKVTSKEAAAKVFTDCMGQRADLIIAIAEERKVSVDDEESMKAIGLEIGKNLMKLNCPAAIQLSVKMAQATDDDATGTTQGTFKRIDTKGFNYVVLTEASRGERSFLWLEQFEGSEKFMGATTGLAGKKLNIRWREIEVYLPEAKGYYKVKLITGVEQL